MNEKRQHKDREKWRFYRTNAFHLLIELIDIYSGLMKGNFWKSPYLNVTYCIDLKKGTWPHHFRKRNIIIRAENTILPSEQHKSYIFFYSTTLWLILYKNPSVPDLYSITGTLSIYIVSSKGFNPYITVADYVSPLYLLTLLLSPISSPFFQSSYLGTAKISPVWSYWKRFDRGRRTWTILASGWSADLGTLEEIEK